MAELFHSSNPIVEHFVKEMMDTLTTCSWQKRLKVLPFYICPEALVSVLTWFFWFKSFWLGLDKISVFTYHLDFVLGLICFDLLHQVGHQSLSFHSNTKTWRAKYYQKYLSPQTHKIIWGSHNCDCRVNLCCIAGFRNGTGPKYLCVLKLGPWFVQRMLNIKD